MSFKIVKSIGKAGKSKNISVEEIDKNVIKIETSTDIEIISDKIIKLPSSCSGLFRETKFKSVDLSTVNSIETKDMSYMFSDVKMDRVDISSLDTSNVENMQGMFLKSIISEIELGDIDTTRVKNMCEMFAECSTIQINLSNLNLANVKYMHSMFENADILIIDMKNRGIKAYITDIFNGINSEVSLRDVRLIAELNKTKS